MGTSHDLTRIAGIFEKQKARSLALRTEKLAARKARLKSFGRFLHENKDRIAEAIYSDFKKPKAESAISELYPVLTEIHHAVAHLDTWAKTQKVDAPLTYLGSRSEVRIEPKGVCLIVAPWNFPFNLCMGPLVSCLAAGNTAILKPSELTPHTSALIAALVSEFFDEDLVTVVEGDQEAVKALMDLPFDHVFFTGSPAVGKIIMRGAAQNLASVTLELGGKSPTVIHETANIEDAARRIAFGKFLNNGQTCIAPDYILVAPTIQDKFIAALQAEVNRLFGVDGKITEASPHYARIVNQKHFDRLQKMLEDARQKNASFALTGPSNRESNFMHPVIVTQVTADMLIMQDEIFGPILPVLPFHSVAEVVQLINVRPKPLALYVFGSSSAFREKILAETSAGSVGINECITQFTHPNLPFGGVNTSGIGKSHGRHGFMSFSNEKPVLKQKRGFAMPYLLHPPYSPSRKKMIDFMLRWL